MVTYQRISFFKLFFVVYREHQQNKNCKAIKGQRFLLLKNYADLDVDGRERLIILFQANKPLLIAHTFKEQVRLLWEQPTIGEAARFFLLCFF
jgi:hypothetical protein